MATQPTFTCATCDASITHHPTFHVGLAFCCAGCAADGPCMCSYDVSVPEAVAVAAPARVTLPESAPVATPVARPAGPAWMPERTRVPATGAAPSLAAARR